MSSVLRRIIDRDASLWPEPNVASTRLGWLDVARRMESEASELTQWADRVDAERIVLLGMGGSSLGSEVLRSSFGDDRLTVLDTTDPTTVASVPTRNSFFLVSSKSGTTLEVDCLLAHFWSYLPDGSRYAAITDPGTPLVGLARERGFRRTFINPPDIGGRYSVLSYFGLVPAALMGVDIATLCEAAAGTDREEAVEFGMEMGQAALREGRNKVTIQVPERFRSFGLWVEQLIAESTGKDGRGCVPVPTTRPEAGDDRWPVEVRIEDPVELGREFFKWELATAAAGHALGIDPFDEPNVAESKENTRRVLDDLPLPSVETYDADRAATWLKEEVGPGDYVSLQAYFPFGHDADLESARCHVSDALGGVATTAGYGPRFLHSTGQLHKGGPDQLVAVQLVPARGANQVPIPGQPYDFATLIHAQALGDLTSLRSHGRRAIRVEVDNIADLAP